MPVDVNAAESATNGATGDESAPKKTRKRKTVEEPVIEAKSIIDVAADATESVTEEPAESIDEAKTFESSDRARSS